MAESWITGALMGHTFHLDSGTRVRLRLARSSDVRAIGDLLARNAGVPDDVGALELVQFDPRARYVVCAAALIDGREQLVGVGAIDLVSDEVAEPDLLVVDPEVGGALSRL